MSEDKIEQLEARIADLKKRMPAHSVPMSMMLEIEALEEELEQLRKPR